MKRFIYIQQYGIVWKFSKSQFAKMLKVVASGYEVNYDDYGGKEICQIDYNTVDMDSEMAENLLEELNKRG